jgi:hypothetical protein
MTLLSNSLEGGTSGTTITTANSGGTSGSAFDVVGIGSGGTAAFSNAQAKRGSLSLLFQTTTANSTGVAWTTSMGTQTQVWFRIYAYFASLPSAGTRFYTVNPGVAGARFTIQANGTILVQDGSNNTLTTSTAAIATGQWVRIEGYVLNSATVGQTQVMLFNSADSATPTETDTSTAVQNTGASSTGYYFGPEAGTANQGPFYADDIAVSNVAYIGPSTFTGTGSPAMAAMAMSGAGSETFTSSGSAAYAPLGLSGVGSQLFAASGSLQLAAPQMLGQVSVPVTVIGTGSLQLAALRQFGRYVTPTGGVTGWDLYSTLQQQAQYADYYRTQQPVACPNDGTPLINGPPEQGDVVLYCPFDGWQYPRDYDPDTHSGM